MDVELHHEPLDMSTHGIPRQVKLAGNRLGAHAHAQHAKDLLFTPRQLGEEHVAFGNVAPGCLQGRDDAGQQSWRYPGLVTQRSANHFQQVLDRFLYNSPRRAELAPRANAIMALHHADWGNKYFGARMDADASRCYRAALRSDPTQCWKGRFIHRYIGLLVGRRIYDGVKRLAHRGY